MRRTWKLLLGATLVAIVVVAFAVTAFGNDEPHGDPRGGGSNGSTGDVASACLVGTPECNDTPGLGGDEPVAHDPGDDPVVDPMPEPQVVEPDPAAVGLRARPFDTSTVGDDGRTIAIDFVSGIEPCYVLGRVDVDEGPNAVTITLFDGHLDTGEDVACIDIGVAKRTIVTLDVPIGDRRIVDGAA